MTVSDNKMKIEKTQNLLYYRKSYEIFNTWLKISKTRKIDREAEKYKNEVRKIEQANQFYVKNILMKAFIAWRQIKNRAIYERNTREVSEQTQKKIDCVIDSLLRPRKVGQSKNSNKNQPKIVRQMSKNDFHQPQPSTFEHYIQDRETRSRSKSNNSASV